MLKSGNGCSWRGVWMNTDRPCYCTGPTDKMYFVLVIKRQMFTVWELMSRKKNRRAIFYYYYWFGHTSVWKSAMWPAKECIPCITMQFFALVLQCSQRVDTFGDIPLLTSSAAASLRLSPGRPWVEKCPPPAHRRLWSLLDRRGSKLESDNWQTCWVVGWKSEVAIRSYHLAISNQHPRVPWHDVKTELSPVRLQPRLPTTNCIRNVEIKI